MLFESELIYYIVLAIIIFIILYIVYISLQFQNNVIEKFTLGNNKKENKSKEEKMIKTLEQQNIALEDVLNLDINKKNYVNMLNKIKRKVNLESLNQILNKGLDDNIKTLKDTNDSIDDLIDFIEND